MAIKFFGEIDIHPTKKFINSEYPAWYFGQHLENLQEEIGKMERSIESGGLPPDKILMQKERLVKMKEKCERIEESRPKLDGGEKDNLAKARKEMGKLIQSGYFTRSQMIKGTADAHREAERMSVPKIEVKSEFGEILQACNVPIVDGKVTRDGMVKAWKIVGKLLNYHGGDEDTNAESLRKD